MRSYISHLSLIHGWLPVALQLISAVVLVCAVGWRPRSWRMIGMSVMLAGAIVLALSARAYIGSLGIAGDPAPPQLWIWIAAAGVAAGGLILGWRGTQRWRRGAFVLAVPMCLLSAALVVNM
jgi:hypothetical protein